MNGYFNWHGKPLAAITAAGIMMMVGAHASAQSRQVPAPPQSNPIIIHSTTVHTVSGDTMAPGVQPKPNQ